MARISSSVRDAASSIVASAVCGTVGVGGGHDAAGLSLDDDGRDVVADAVMELAGQLVALTQLGLLDVADPGIGVEADRRTERGGEQDQPVAGDHLGGRKSGWRPG